MFSIIKLTTAAINITSIVIIVTEITAFELGNNIAHDQPITIIIIVT